MDIIKAHYTFSRQYLYKFKLCIVYITNWLNLRNLWLESLYYGFQFFLYSIGYGFE